MSTIEALAANKLTMLIFFKDCANAENIVIITPMLMMPFARTFNGISPRRPIAVVNIINAPDITSIDAAIASMVPGFIPETSFMKYFNSISKPPITINPISAPCKSSPLNFFIAIESMTTDAAMVIIDPIPLTLTSFMESIIFCIISVNKYMLPNAIMAPSTSIVDNNFIEIVNNKMDFEIVDTNIPMVEIFFSSVKLAVSEVKNPPMPLPGAKDSLERDERFLITK